MTAALPTSAIPAAPAIVAEIKSIAFQLESAASRRDTVASRMTARNAYAESLSDESAERAELMQKSRADEQTLSGLAAVIKSMTADMESKRSAMGEEILELIRSVNADLRDLLESPAIRSDAEVMESTLKDAHAHISEAVALYAYVRKVQDKGLSAALADVPAPAPAPAAVIETAHAPAGEVANAPETAAPVAAVEAEAPAAPVARPEDEIPAELSAYHMCNRQGHSLMDFGIRFKKPLAELLKANKFDVPFMTAFLKERGLNGGSLRDAQVVNLLRNAGIRLTPDSAAETAVSPDTKLMVCRVLGVNGVCEVTPTGFRVKAGSVGRAVVNPSFPERQQEQRKKLIRQKVARIIDNQLVVQRDHEFGSLTAAAAFLTGSTMSGIAAWRATSETAGQPAHA